MSPSSEPRAAPCAHTVRVPFCDPYDVVHAPDGSHASHLDMLHNSPNAVGIAWDSGNAYWVFDGYHNSLTFYDFVAIERDAAAVSANTMPS